MRAVGIIPARYDATRFPGKPLAEISGLPMVQHVWRGARLAKHLGEVIIATDDERIADVCRGFGAEVVLTRADHPTGTDRIAEVAASRDEDLVVNIQGDEPLIEGFVIDAAVDALLDAADAPMATVVHAAGAAPASPGATHLATRGPLRMSPRVPRRIRRARINPGGARRGPRTAVRARKRTPHPLRRDRRLGEHAGGRARRHRRRRGPPARRQLKREPDELGEQSSGARSIR
jgi:molybdopterin-guanine dinucleotide biosynthesis protein A